MTESRPVPPPADEVHLPYALRFAAAWAWRVLLVLGAVYVGLRLFSLLSVVLVPVILGLLLAALASPLADRLGRHMPRSLATAIVVVAGLGVLSAALTLVGQQFATGFNDLRDSFTESLGELERYLADLGFSREQVQNAFDRVREAVGSDGNVSGRIVQATTTAGHIVAGAFIMLFTVIFLVYDGRGIWAWFVRLFPARARARVQGSGELAWDVLTSYVQATILIAAVDALGIALVAWILGLPLVLPIAVLVFLGGFVPIVGATISGIAAVAVALVFEGPVSALIMLGGVLGVQQLEGHVLQPFLMGRFVRVHPLAVVVVIAIGALVAGIFGALIAVPLTAIVNSVATYLANHPAEPEPQPTEGAA